MRIPPSGLSATEVFASLDEYRSEDVPWRDGRLWAYIYDPGPEAEAVIHQAFTTYLTDNGLDPTAFPSALRLETEVIRMAANHLHGDDQVVGSFTSGGTESIMLALKAARDKARELRPEITRPELLLPETAHAAFQKACHYLGVTPVLADVDPDTFRADPEAMAAAITPNTIMMVGSAISYAHGVVDPIEELGQIALEHDLWFHVDGCMGGFMLNWLEQIGRDIPRYDFRVPGVTTISMDLHKYAFAAKGASTLLYRSAADRRYQVYACSNWSGYTIVNPTVQSTKSSGPVAAAWAVLNFFGAEGYLDTARTVMSMTERMIEGINAHPDLRVLGSPDMNMFAFASDTVNLFHVVDEMKDRGWFMQPQLSFGCSPVNLHLSMNPSGADLVDELLEKLAESVEAAKALPSGKLRATIIERFGHLQPSDITDEVFGEMLAVAAVEGTALPGRTADINEVLDALPVPLSERLIAEYVNLLYR